jgi:hypothetical protein
MRNSPMSDDASIRLENLKRLRLSSSQLRNTLGRGQSFWSDLLGGKKSFGEKLARSIEEGLSIPRGWLDVSHEENAPLPLTQDNAPADTITEAPVAGRLAHPLSLLTPIVTPTIMWGDLPVVFNKLPREFRIAAPDDSMSPKARKGELCSFEVLAEDVQPRQGDGVLVRDDAGHFYIRIFKPRRPDHWEAHAVDPDVLPLDSVRDGLTVLAVLVGVQQGRWG